ncbi:MAG: hypothetical protein BZY80_02280 [SAR202 cluster bacterium Io17-Chloro-G2]|nr:MAG: hypothetical protein BZY80_02280 [SAR202 cluster bacterium Io17-Chloro-G2]
MGCILMILRPIASFVLGIIVFAGLILLVVGGNLTGKLLDPDFYTGALAEQDTYNRIYTEILVDPDLELTTQDLLGNINVDQADIVPLLRDILPPEYIQAQVEEAIGRTVGYLNGDLEELEVYLDLGPPLANAKQVLLAYVDEQIDVLPVEELDAENCTPEGVQEKAQDLKDLFAGLASGQTPESLPSLPSLDEACREDLFAQVDELAIVGGALDQAPQEGLLADREELQRQLLEGDSKGFLKQASHAVAAPLVDAAIGRVSGGMIDQGRFDVIKAVAAYDEARTEAEIRQNLTEARETIVRAESLGGALAIVMFFGGLALMALVYFPNLANMIRWPGVTLLMTGGVVYGAGRVLESNVSDRLGAAIQFGAGGASPVPSSVVRLTTDLLVSFGHNLTSGITGPALTVLIVGFVLFVASFFVFTIKPFIPFLK